MGKQRHNPFSDTGKPLNKQTDNCAQKNKKYLKYVLLFLGGIVIGVLAGAIFKGGLTWNG